MVFWRRSSRASLNSGRGVRAANDLHIAMILLKPIVTTRFSSISMLICIKGQVWEIHERAATKLVGLWTIPGVLH